MTRVVLDLLKATDRDRFHPFLAVSHVEGVRMPEVPEGVRAHSLNAKKDGRGTEFFSLVAAFRRVLRAVDPDVVLSSIWKSNMIALAAHRLEPSARRRLILRMDNPLAPYFKEAHGTGVRGKISPLMTRLLYPRADRLIAVSEGLRSECVRFGLPGGKVAVIHNPIDLEEIERKSREPVEDGPAFILFAGRLSRQKNLPLLIEAFRLIDDRPDLNLVLLGRGEEAPRLKNLVRDLGLERRVLFKGYVSNPYAYMRRARAFVLPSDHEAFPCVLLEAMACRTPAVSTRCPHGPDEIIRDGVNGFLVPTGDAGRLAEAIRRLLEDQPLRESLVERAYQDVRRYEMNAVARRYEEAMLDVLSAGKT